MSINIRLDGGKYLHVSFTPQTGGGSIFYTNDAGIQAALERHPRYGRLFREDTAYKPRAEALPSSGKEEHADGEPGEGKRIVKVGDPEEAKAYLAENFGVSRTKLKSLKAIREAAEAHGVEFEGL